VELQAQTGRAHGPHGFTDRTVLVTPGGTTYTPAMTTSQRLASRLTFAYGLVAAIGGTIGYVKAGSVASLIAGGGSGVLLLICATLVAKKPKLGLIGAIVLSVLLIGRFASTAAKSGASPVAIIMIVGGVAVLIASALALKSGDSPR
jgi:uncharacterized membrane protein (UPF0136 family)